MLLGMAKAPTDRRHALGALQVRNVRLFLAGQTAAQSGTWLQFVALAWLAGRLTGSGSALGWVAVAMFGPLLVLGPWTGPWPTASTSIACSSRHSCWCPARQQRRVGRLGERRVSGYGPTVGLWPTDERGLVGLGWFCAKPTHVPKWPPTHGTPFIVGMGPPETIVGAPL
jgi:hypothetical protein